MPPATPFLQPHTVSPVHGVDVDPCIRLSIENPRSFHARFRPQCGLSSVSLARGDPRDDKKRMALSVVTDDQTRHYREVIEQIFHKKKAHPYFEDGLTFVIEGMRTRYSDCGPRSTLSAISSRRNLAQAVCPNKMADAVCGPIEPWCLRAMSRCRRDKQSKLLSELTRIRRKRSCRLRLSNAN
jgi:hypothetical protein